MSTVSKQEFSAGMRQLCSGVTVITTHHDNMDIGLTATAVSSLCAEPPRLLVCVNRAGISYKSIQKSRVFGVNILSTEQVELAKRFAGMIEIHGEDRFEQGDWLNGITGAPMLKGALVSFDCEVESVVETGTHGIIIGNIKSIEVQEGKRPLLYGGGNFQTSCDYDT